MRSGDSRNHGLITPDDRFWACSSDGGSRSSFGTCESRSWPGSGGVGGRIHFSAGDSDGEARIQAVADEGRGRERRGDFIELLTSSSWCPATTMMGKPSAMNMDEDDEGERTEPFAHSGLEASY
uniref:Uncharacterized protein n=1 Tax=Arundo donax TaxID=35708 RepID=A0A0A9CHG3_ARUDO